MNIADAHVGLFEWPMAAAPSAPGDLCVFGAPADHGNPIRKGTARAPEAIRRASLSLPPPRCGAVDLGDIGRNGAMDANAYLARLARTVVELRAGGGCPLMLGGDHSLSFGPVSALLREGDLGVIWFDAHTDFSEWSGAVSHDHKQVLRRIAGLDGVQRIVQIGYRGITTGDERWLGDRASVLTTAQARDLAPSDLLTLIPDSLPCYLSIDIDVLDPLIAPGTGAPVPDGLTPRQVATLAAALVARRRIVGIDLVEVNPTLDRRGDTVAVAAELLHAIATHWPADRHHRDRPPVAANIPTSTTVKACGV